MGDSTPAGSAALLPSDLEVGGDVELPAIGSSATSAAIEEGDGDGDISDRMGEDEDNTDSNAAPPPLRQDRENEPAIDGAQANTKEQETKPEPIRRKPPPVKVDPAKLLEPIRTDPIKALEARKRRLERQVEPNIPEVHYVGQILSICKVIRDVNEGAFCRWKIDFGTAWEHLDGEVLGQTHVSYCSISEKESLPLCHPIDAHFAAAGLQGWNAPRLTVQCYRLDLHGRKILAGYGFMHLPLAIGAHRLDIDLWRPVGTPEQELRTFLLGEGQALIDHEPIYEAAWKDRCRLLTVSAGKVSVELFCATRNLYRQDIDDHMLK